MDAAISNRLSRSLLAILVGLQLVWSPLAVPADDPSRLKTLKSDIARLQKRLKSAEKQQSQLLRSLRSKELEIGRLNTEIRDAERRLDRIAGRRELLEAREGQLQAELRTEEQQLYRQVRASYMSGQQEHLKLLLHQTEPEALMRMMKYYEYLNQARLGRINEFSGKLASLHETQQNMAIETRALEEARARLATRQASLDESRRARLATLSKLAGSIEEQAGELKLKQIDQKRLQNLLNTVRESVPDIAAPRAHRKFAKMRGKLPWPTRGKVINTYGQPADGGPLHENGLQIRAGAGATVYAVHDGRVVFADWLRHFGLLIIVDHDDGYMSLYAHNQTLLKEAGEWVGSGEAISTVGDSGGQAESGLYFELRYKGKPDNPKKWLQARN